MKIALSNQTTVELSSIQIPDLWNIAHLPELNGYSLGGKSAALLIVDCWHLAHDLKRALETIDGAMRETKPFENMGTSDVKWTAPASEGACKALLEHARLINPDVLIMAQGAAIQRGKDEGRSASIVRADVEQAIIANQAAAITAQANRIRNMASVEVELRRKIHELEEKLLFNAGASSFNADSGSSVKIGKQRGRK